MARLVLLHGEPACTAEIALRPRVAELAGAGTVAADAATFQPIADDEPDVAVVLPSVQDTLALGRRLRRAWPGAHLLLVQPPGDLDAFRQALGPAPMLGRNWSLAPLGPALVATARQALGSARQRRAFQARLQTTNEQLASSEPVPRAEYQRLIASQHHLANFLRHATDAVAGVDARRQVLFWSGGAQDLLGHRAADALGRPIDGLGPWGPALAAAIRRVLDTGGSETLESTHAGPVGEQVVEFVVSALQQEGGRPPGASVLARDVTERRRAHDRLEQSRQQLERLVEVRTRELEKNQLALIQAQKLEAIGKLTGGVAHDFNNVLQVIGSNLQLVQMRLGVSHGAEQFLRAALSGVERGARLSSQLLAFARRQPLNPVPLSISRRVQEMDELVRRALGEHVQVESVLAAGLWTTLADPVQLENVILNLAINARDAMPAGGKLTIETANCTLDDSYAAEVGDVPPGQYVMLAVSDTGTGMPPEVVAHAFEPFFTTKPEGKGSGLGLSMAYGFAKQSGGHIRIYSEEGQGTTIRVYLPRSAEAEVRPARVRETAMSRGSETILVVEDDPAVQTAAVSMLQALGYRVLRAGDAQAALNILQSGVQVDLLFTDVVMPGPLRSPELARRAKVLLPRIAVLFTSGYTQNAIVHGGRLDPGVELLSKPYRQQDLAAKVRQLLQGARGAPVQAEPPAARAPSILLVEDQADQRDTAAELLRMLGCRVTAVATAEAAERALSGSDYDVLLTDVTLPGRSGVELALDVARSHPATRIVFASGHGAALRVPAHLPHRLLPKPYGPDELQAAIGEGGAPLNCA